MEASSDDIRCFECRAPVTLFETPGTKHVSCPDCGLGSTLIDAEAECAAYKIDVATLTASELEARRYLFVGA